MICISTCALHICSIIYTVFGGWAGGGEGGVGLKDGVKGRSDATHARAGWLSALLPSNYMRTNVTAPL